jgi:tetratricopeptide (TPR) repeat protein
LYFYNGLITYCGDQYAIEREYAAHCLAGVYSQMHKWHKAIEWYTKDLDLSAANGIDCNAWSYSGRANAYSNLGQYKKAAKDFELAIDAFGLKSPLDAQDSYVRAQYGLAKMEMLMGHPEKARPWLREIIDQRIIALNQAADDIRSIQTLARDDLAKLSDR